MVTILESYFSLSAANTQPCYSGGPATLVCKAVIDETHDCKTFVFEDVLSRSFDFKPGQYASFKFEIDGQTHARAYSMSSTPTRPHNIQVTVKRVPGGLVSNFLNDEMKPGVKVEISDIGGAFNCLDLDAEKPLYLSGGSGVTPVISMLQYLTDVNDPKDVVFVHFARSPKDIIFRDQLEFLAKRFKNVKVHMVVDDLGDAKRFDGVQGQINAELMRDLVPDHAERTIYMCGPEGFMKAARKVAEDMPVKALHEESFGEKIVFEDVRGLGGEVYFSQSGKSGTCGEDQTLLETALNAGVWIESACQQGVCGVCKVMLAQGEVEMTDLGGLQEPERAEGYVLACCSRPKGAVTLNI